MIARNIHSMTMGIAAIAIVCSTAVAQPVCETDYTGPNNGSWHEPANWLGGSPNSTLVACIPAGITVRIHEGTVDAEAVWVKRDATSGPGVLRIAFDGDYSELRLFASSQVDGTVEIGLKGTLTAMTDLTIKGINGDIVGVHSDANIQSGPNNSSIVTFKNGANGGTRADSLTVHGTLEIHTPIINERAFVVADSGDLLLSYLDPRNSSATKGGYWIAERAPSASTAGTLHIKESVDGAGTWQLAGDSAATIIIDAVCNQNAGPVFLQKGTFEVMDVGGVKDGFYTTGRLTMESINGSEPRLIVHQGAVARFDN